MSIRRNGSVIPRSSDITPRGIFESRRAFIRQLALGSIAGGALAGFARREALADTRSARKLAARVNPAFVAGDRPTRYEDATTYNNFYEFGAGKTDPARHADTLQTHPWTVTIEGEVRKPLTLDIDSLLRLAPLEERIYRLRCVEGWSMVIPWIGYPFSALIKKAEPTGNARYVQFVSLADQRQMPGVRGAVLDWPYAEGLRLDEAAHRLTLLTLGMYGEVLPNQNGAPVRIVVPWKYGFKSPKSIVKIRFTRNQPKTAWNVALPEEYGFYSNVNPAVDHPRWSQASERRIGEDGFFARKRRTLMFNGYGEVASLYTGMDLKKFY